MSMLVHICQECSHNDQQHTDRECSHGWCACKAGRSQLGRDPLLIPTFKDGKEVERVAEPGSKYAGDFFYTVTTCDCDVCRDRYAQLA